MKPTPMPKKLNLKRPAKKKKQGEEVESDEDVEQAFTRGY